MGNCNCVSKFNRSFFILKHVFIPLNKLRGQEYLTLVINFCPSNLIKYSSQKNDPPFFTPVEKRFLFI